MSLGPNPPPRAPYSAFVMAVPRAPTGLAGGGGADLGHEVSEVMLGCGSAFGASVRQAGVLEPRWGGLWVRVFAHRGSPEPRTSYRQDVRGSNQAISPRSMSHRVRPVSFDT